MRARTVASGLIIAATIAIILLVRAYGITGALRQLSGAAVPLARAQEPHPTLPAAPIIPPIPEHYTQALPPGISVVIRDIAFDHRRILLRVPFVEVVGRTGSGVRLASVHIRGARVVSRQTGVTLPIDPFMKLTDQRIEIGRLRIDDTFIRRQLLTGETHWHVDDLDLDMRSVVLGGTAAEGFRLVHADMTGRFEDAPIDVRALSANVRRGNNRLAGDVDVQLAETHARAEGSLVRNGPFTADVGAETSNFAELHAFAEKLPRTGAGTVLARITGDEQNTTLALDRAYLNVNQSSVSARGVVTMGEARSFENVVVDIPRLRAADLKQAFDMELPGGGEVRGRLSANGVMREGARVDAELHRLVDGDSTQLRLNGVLRDSSGMRVDVYAYAQPVRAADTLMIVALHARGPVDTLAITGDVTLANAGVVTNGDALREPGTLYDARARIDAVITNADSARIARGTAVLSATAIDRETGDAVPLSGRMEGAVTLASAGGINATVRADSLPLRLVPTPDQVHSVEGLAHGAFTISGTVKEPRVTGAITVDGAALSVRRYETRLERLNGTIRVDNDVVITDGLTGALGDGTLRLSGTARLRGEERPVDATLRIDRGTIVNNDSLRAIASSELRLSGDVAAPRVRGHVTVHSGRFDEDMMKESEPLDLASPPYASLAARVPWIRESRLLPRDTVLVDEDSDAVRSRRVALDAEVALRVEPGFKIVDEDSEMFGTGDITLKLDSIGVVANGSYRIEGGAYNNFGERFRVVGGIFHFPGQGTISRVSLRGEHQPDAPLGYDLGTGRNALDFYPPLESFAIGSLSGISEEVQRLSLLPEDMTQLGSVLLYREPVEPVTEWRTRRWWRADAGATVVGPRAGTQLFPLLWAYTADETYDLIPLSSAYLRASTIEVGPPYPGRTVITGVVGGGLRRAPLEVDVRQPLKGDALPGVHVRYSTGRWLLSLFNEPRFRALPAAGSMRGYMHDRRNGVRVLWRAEW